MLWLPRWDTLWYCVLPWHGWLHADATAIQIISAYCCDSLWTSLLRGKFWCVYWARVVSENTTGIGVPHPHSPDMRMWVPCTCQQALLPTERSRIWFFFNSSVDHVSRQQCAHSTRHRIWQAKQPASYLSLVQMTDFSVHRQFRIIWRFYFESNWRIFFFQNFQLTLIFHILLQSLLNKTSYYLLKSAKNKRRMLHLIQNYFHYFNFQLKKEAGRGKEFKSRYFS